MRSKRTVAEIIKGRICSLTRHTHTQRDGISPEVGGFDDKVVVVALQVAVLPAENVQDLPSHKAREKKHKFVVFVLVHPAVIRHKKAPPPMLLAGCFVT